MPRPTQRSNEEELLHRFGRGIRRLREKRNLSQEDFAELADVHRTYVGMLERGEKSPTLGTVAAWARAFGLRPSDLLREVGL